MFGNAPDTATSDQFEPKQDKPVSALGELALAFFASRGGKVSIASNPRPLRPESPPRPVVPAHIHPFAAPSSPFAATSDVAMRAREDALAAEADIVDDMFFESEAPGC